MIEEQEEKFRHQKMKERDDMPKKNLKSNNEFQRKNKVKNRLLKKLERKKKLL